MASRFTVVIPARRWVMPQLNSGSRGDYLNCTVQLNQPMYDDLQAKRLRMPARYPVVHSKIHMFAFDGATIKFEKNDVFVGEVPDWMIVGLLDSRAFNGTLNYYPFSFQKFGLIQIHLVVEN